MLLVFLTLPTAANAAVIINEIAWMGTEASANDEWIELYNSGGGDVLLEGWTLSDGINLNIELAGTIGVGEFAVLERTDDTSAAGTAFLIYTGALSNTGATLTLIRASADIEDQVAGGEDWENIGGDNTTKETAQYASSGWLTAIATPGKTNATEDRSLSENDEETEESNSSDTVVSKISSGDTKKTVSLTLPDVELLLTIDAPDVVYVHQPFTLSVAPDGLGTALMESLVYTWNFGDISTQKGKDTSHMYEYPGKYVIVAHAEYARHEQVARHTITVLPVAFSMTRTREGDIQIHNDAKYEVNVSGYVIAGKKNLVLPHNTVLLPRSTLTISKNQLGISSFDIVVLYDQEKSIVATTQKSSVATVAAATPVTEVVAISRSPAPAIVSASKPQTDLSTSSVDFAFISDQKEEILIPAEIIVSKDQEPVSPSNAAAVIEGAGLIPKETLPYLGLMGVISLAFIGLFAGRIK